MELIPGLAFEEPDTSDSASSTSSIKRVRVSRSDGHRAQKDDNSDEDVVVPATPVQGRRKKRRRWVWTLGKVESKRTEAGAEDEPKGYIEDQCISGHIDGLGVHIRNSGKEGTPIPTATSEPAAEINCPSSPGHPNIYGSKNVIERTIITVDTIEISTRHEGDAALKTADAP